MMFKVWLLRYWLLFDYWCLEFGYYFIIYFTTKSPTLEVLYPILPAVRLFTSILTTFMISSSIRFEAFSSPRFSSIIWQAEMAARGLTTPFPVYFGADPPIGSNIETPSGLIFHPAAIPNPPSIIAPS